MKPSDTNSDEIAVVQSREHWKALLSVVRLDTMKYTPQGEMIFAAYQAVALAVEGPV